MRIHEFWNNIELKSENCYVAFLDIQGFKDYIFNHTLDDVSQLYESIFDQLDGMRKEHTWRGQTDYQLKKYNTLARKAYIYVMSDSIIIAIDKKHRGALQFLFENCARIQQQLLIKHRILIRGGISFGSFCGTKRVAYGRGLVNAYLIEEAPWNKLFRIAIDPTIIKSLHNHRYYCITNSYSYTDPHQNIFMIDYIDSLPRSPDAYPGLVDYYYDQYEAVHKQGEETLADKYHWLALELAYAERRAYLAMREHESIMIDARQYLK